MNWRGESKNLNLESESDLAIRIKDIKDRIDCLRRSIESDDIPIQSVEVETVHHEEVKIDKRKELDDIKAKLMGKKK
jgi:hypothetical protein